MKRVKFISAFICFLMAVACVKITNTQTGKVVLDKNGQNPILFSKQTKALVDSESNTGYDEFKLFTWNSLEQIIMNPYVVVAYGVNDYHYENLPDQELKYFNSHSDWYDFIGIIPTDHEMTLNNGSVRIEGVKSFSVDDKRADCAVDLEDNLYWNSGLAEDSPEEFLTAYKRVTKDKYGSSVDMPFKHENAIIFLGFSSNRTDTELINYTPEIPWKPGQPDGTKIALSEKRKMFDVMSEGKLVGYPLDVSVENNDGGHYTGQLGNFFNIWPSDNYITQQRLEELKPLVNAQFVYTDENGNIIDTDWEYRVNRKNKIFLAFAEGVNASEFIAGNDAFWTNLTETEKSALKNYHDSGCRAIRINKNADGDYFVWGESYGTYMNTTSRYLTIIDGPSTPEIKGIRVFSADSLGVNNLPTDTLYCVHKAHTLTADATISPSGCLLSNKNVGNDVIQYSLPENTTLSTTAIWSPTTFYALPGDEEFNYIVVKVSYIYNGIVSYDVRVPIKLPDGGLQAGKYYKYELHITSVGNGTENPNEAANEKDEILIEEDTVINVNLVEIGYMIGDSKKITI